MFADNIVLQVHKDTFPFIRVEIATCIIIFIYTCMEEARYNATY